MGPGATANNTKIDAWAVHARFISPSIDPSARNRGLLHTKRSPSAISASEPRPESDQGSASGGSDGLAQIGGNTSMLRTQTNASSGRFGRVRTPL
jgi:hypothetical protein